MYDYNRIVYEARERARSREDEAARERITRASRIRPRRQRRLRLSELLHSSQPEAADELTGRI